ncbi:porin [Enterovirga sp.]|jgi:hypothetical protein|uniref:porin n=1 Tax=Enterovirga sp. TaxID=2026350 RepID=UPI0026376420|nr:porin [Enterovirga sp.]MDB5589635.1 porin [Enterovirga sp.]
MRRAALLLILVASPACAWAADRAPADAARSCPRYGPGFVEVPGTSTCIRISGRVATDYTASARRVSRDDVPGFRTRGQVSVDSRTDTAYGPVRGYVRMRAGPHPGF